MTIGERQLLSIIEFAEMAGFSDRTVRSMIEDGRITPVRFGKTVRIPISYLHSGSPAGEDPSVSNHTAGNRTGSNEPTTADATAQRPDTADDGGNRQSAHDAATGG